MQNNCDFFIFCHSCEGRNPVALFLRFHAGTYARALTVSFLFAYIHGHLRFSRCLFPKSINAYLLAHNPAVLPLHKFGVVDQYAVMGQRSFHSSAPPSQRFWQ